MALPPNRSGAAYLRSLFDSMSNHMAKSVNWEPKISSSATRTPVAAVIEWPEDAQDDQRDPEREAGQAHHDPEDVEEDERVEVADHVLLAQPPEERLHEQPRDARDDLAQPDSRPLADAVDRPRRHVSHAGVHDVQVDEHVVREAVTGVEAVEVEGRERVVRETAV